MAEFNPNITVGETSWLVEGLIPNGHLCIFLAQAGVGKSLWAESLAVHVSSGVDFCHLKTISSDVLIIDQDTPTKVLQKRLSKFFRGITNIQETPGQNKNKLFFESMNGYNFSDGTIFTLIKDHPTAKLVIIDSLFSVCGKLNPNSISDLNQALVKLKNECLSEDKVIIINHHISEKMPDASLEFLMTENPHVFSMGASSVIQQADTYYVIGASAENGTTSRIYLRPIAKRAPVNSTPKIFRLIQPEQESERMEFDGEWDGVNLANEERDVLMYFKANPQDTKSVLDVYKDTGHMHGETAIRKALQSLEKKGLLVLLKQRGNLFKYKLP
jgi:hypothetical protein